MLDGRRSPILKKDKATRYRSACMRLSYLAQDRLDLAETAKHLSQRMSEPREFDFNPLKRAARYLVGKPKAALRFRRQKHVDKITVFVHSAFPGDPVSKNRTTGLVAQIGNHTVKSGSTLQSLTALSVGEAEFSAVLKGSQFGLSLRSMYQGLGIPVKIGIPSDSSTANSLTTSAEHTSKEQQRTSFTHAFHIWQVGYANRIFGESGSFRRSRHSAALFHNPNQDVGTAMHGDNFEHLIRVSFSNPKTQ